jgi:ADP-ribose pyrophosphatase YjhB (NUDIX family)
VTRIEHVGDPRAPKANSLVPAASAVVTDADGKVLLQRRTDNQMWSIPGGRMEIGETISETATRETAEETGLEVRPIYVVGIYSDPDHVVEYDDGEVRQEFSVCFACEVVGGSIQTSQESSEVGFFARNDIESMAITDSIRHRIEDFFRGNDRAVFD